MDFKKIIISLIFIVIAIIVILLLLSYGSFFNRDASDLNEKQIVRNILVKDITYEYDEGLSAYIIYDETGTQRKKVNSEEELEYYKENPERLYDEYVYQEAQNYDITNEIIEY